MKPMMMKRRLLTHLLLLLTVNLWRRKSPTTMSPRLSNQSNRNWRVLRTMTQPKHWKRRKHPTKSKKKKMMTATMMMRLSTWTWKRMTKTPNPSLHSLILICQTMRKRMTKPMLTAWRLLLLLLLVTRRKSPSQPNEAAQSASQRKSLPRKLFKKIATRSKSLTIQWRIHLLLLLLRRSNQVRMLMTVKKLMPKTMVYVDLAGLPRSATWILSHQNPVHERPALLLAKSPKRTKRRRRKRSRADKNRNKINC
mmetsp:Transcript_1559/g.3166  ORF Transcript_1559/g.3166 Transcript_1559/m.3166 type:complete len:252 (+) Transcript_1559:287-1042(+)